MLRNNFWQPHIAYALSKTAGFFSQFFFVCHVYLYSKHIGKSFVLIDQRWLYQKWHDYFTSLHVVHSYPNPFVYNQDALNQLFKCKDYEHVVRELFVLRNSLRLRVETVVSSLPPDFIGLFVRRGDKLISEAPYIPMRDILSKIPYTDSNVFFIQTDDYGVIEEIKDILPNKIVYTVPDTKRGSHHDDWVTKKTPSQIREETEEMLVGLAVCLRSTQCWTDHTSNVGRFLKLYSPTTVSFYTTDLVYDEERLIHPSFSIVG